MILRVLDTGPMPARWNAAMSAALLAGVDEGAAPALRFHRYPVSCVIGRNQDAEAELDLDVCRAAGIEIARRVTGGGAVVMGPGVLAFDLILPARMREASDIGRRIGEALVRALAGLGFAAGLATPGSIEIGGHKVSGSAGRLGRRALLHQATLILDLSETAPLSLLRRRTEGGRPTADPGHRVTDLAFCVLQDATSRLLSVTRQVESSPSVMLRSGPEGRVSKHAPDLQHRLTDAFAAAFGLTPVSASPSASELSGAAHLLAREIGRDDYTFGDRHPIEEAA